MQQGPPFATPVLETARLRLRGRTLDDFAFFREMWADPAVTRYIDGKPRSEEDTWTKFLRMIGHWSVMGFGYWAVEEKESGALIGEAGFAATAKLEPLTGKRFPGRQAYFRELRQLKGITNDEALVMNASAARFASSTVNGRSSTAI